MWRFAPWAHGTAARRSAGGIRLECSHDRRTALGLLSHIRPGAVFLADRAYDNERGKRVRAGETRPEPLPGEGL